MISPSWSIHSGVGTRAYTFIWGMVGENQVFDDMDHESGRFALSRWHKKPAFSGFLFLIAGHFHSQTAARSFSIFGVHVFACFVHGVDNLIKADAGFAGTA